VITPCFSHVIYAQKAVRENRKGEDYIRKGEDYIRKGEDYI